MDILIQLRKKTTIATPIALEEKISDAVARKLCGAHGFSSHQEQIVTAATLHNLRHTVHYCLVDNVTITIDDNAKADQLRREIVHKIEAYNRRFDRACVRLTNDEALRKRLKLEIEYAAQRYGISGTEPWLTEQEIDLAIVVYTTLCHAILKETNHEITKALLNTADSLYPILGQ
ncbi:TPA: hypothetical protein ACIVK2_000351 [Salmonella enterica subsp. enterica serovar 6,8:z4,z23:-]